jgi:hypothetical protein
MATDEDGSNRTTVFSQEAVFYAMVDLKNAPDDTKLKAVWRCFGSLPVGKHGLSLAEGKI